MFVLIESQLFLESQKGELMFDMSDLSSLKGLKENCQLVSRNVSISSYTLKMREIPSCPGYLIVRMPLLCTFARSAILWARAFLVCGFFDALFQFFLFILVMVGTWHRSLSPVDKETPGTQTCDFRQSLGTIDLP